MGKPRVRLIQTQAVQAASDIFANIGHISLSFLSATPSPRETRIVISTNTYPITASNLQPMASYRQKKLADGFGPYFGRTIPFKSSPRLIAELARQQREC